MIYFFPVHFYTHDFIISTFINLLDDSLVPQVYLGLAFGLIL